MANMKRAQRLADRIVGQLQPEPKAEVFRALQMVLLWEFCNSGDMKQGHVLNDLMHGQLRELIDQVGKTLRRSPVQ